MATPEVQSLYELQRFIRQVLALNFQDNLWVQAEISSVQESKGHIFIDLIGKSEDRIEAQASAVIWNTTFRKLRRKHGKSLDQVLRTGMEIQLEVSVNFHEQFGYKLIVSDVDTAFSIGILEQKRLATIEKLKSSGLFGKNKELAIPTVVQRIAVISSPNAAGLEDFLQQLRHNRFDYNYSVQLFPASVQGENAEKEILHAFAAIRRKAEKFDAICLLRGGGARTDLLAFDQEKLCTEGAKLPLPLLTGIGHERDESILDMVAHTALKTPTAVAEFLIQHNLDFESLLETMDLRLHEISRQKIQSQVLRLNSLADRLESAAQLSLQKHRFQLREVEALLEILSPESTLKRGYIQLTDEQGSLVTKLTQLKIDMELRAKLEGGSAYLKVDRKEKE